MAHQNHTVSVTWSNNIEAVIDLSPVIAPLRDRTYFVSDMRVAEDRLGLEWPDRVDFSADGLRFRAFPSEAEGEFQGQYSMLPRPHAA